MSSLNLRAINGTTPHLERAKDRAYKQHGWAVHISINMMVTVGVSTWTISSLPVSILAVTKIGVAMTVFPKVVYCLVCS